MQELIITAFKGIYPEKNLDKETYLKFSRKFKPYNASVRIFPHKLAFRLSYSWKETNKEIVIGLIQSLLVKALKIKNKSTINIDLYNNFLKNLHMAMPKIDSDLVLEESFSRVNEKYFYGVIEKPNLVWGSESTTKLGSYEYALDRITISSIFKKASPEILDYIMYHELLHKKHKFSSKNGRTRHHDLRFRDAEKAFENSKRIERELKRICAKEKIKGFFLPRWLR